jgi:hypothetical protein
MHVAQFGSLIFSANFATRRRPDLVDIVGKCTMPIYAKIPRSSLCLSVEKVIATFDASRG